MTIQEKYANQPTYELKNGTADTINFDPRHFIPMDEAEDDPMHTLPLGVYLRGTYNHFNDDDSVVLLPVVSFLYNKFDEDSGSLETLDRAIILLGTASGVHEDNKFTGQPPADYLIGAQIGQYDDTLKRVTRIKGIGPIEPQHFSEDCIYDGARGDNPFFAGQPIPGFVF